MAPHVADGPTPFDEAIRCVEELALQRRPGEHLPSERELAEQLAVSRLTVREALRSLAARGLVELSQGRRAVVRDPSSAVLAGYFSVSMRRSPRSLMELLAIRRALEGLSASTAARSATRTGLDLLESTLHQMASAAGRLDGAEPGTGEAADALEDYVRADLAFHGTLAVVSGNALLAQLLEGLSDALGQAFRESVRGHRARGGSHADVVQQHRRVVDAVRRGDPVAATAAMERHLTETASDLRAAGEA